MIFRNLRPSELKPEHIIQLTGLSEGSQLEFKQELQGNGSHREWVDGGGLKEEAKRQLGKRLVAFANTDGGWLFLGVAEKDDRASEIVPIARAVLLASTLSNSFATKLTPHLPDLEVAAIIMSADQGVIAIRVGPSPMAPHRSDYDMEFYRRSDKETLAMSPVQIADMSVQVWKGRSELQERLRLRQTPQLALQQNHDFHFRNPDGSLGSKVVTLYPAAFRFTALPMRSISRNDIAKNAAFHFPLPPLVVRNSADERISFCSGSDANWRPKLLGIFASDTHEVEANETRHFEIGSDGMIECKGTLFPKIVDRPGGLDIAVHAMRFFSLFAWSLAFIIAYRRMNSSRHTSYLLDLHWITADHFMLRCLTDQGYERKANPIEVNNRLEGFVLEEEEAVDYLWDNIQREFFQSFGLVDAKRYPIDFDDAVKRILAKSNWSAS